MVNFFEHQQQARRNTGLLVILFFLAFALIIAAVTLVAAFVIGAVGTNGQGDYQLSWEPFIWVSTIVGGGILLVMLFKWLQLKAGGKVVAEHLGGTLVSPDTQDAVERRVMNVVEEMAIAANMPVPAVYILPNESSINAFAAGYDSRDAVIGLTRGAIDSFSREQLQGVVAHEFSHILNGDMRLNIRLIAALAGILAVAHLGRILLYSGHASRGRNNKNALPLFGLGLIILGGIGILFGNLIKSAVSRQREFLADAAAVQFTRNPEGLSGALKQIGAREHGSRVQHKNADEAAHLFFGEALSHWFGMMATHPPLAKRIKRIEPHWNGHYPEPRTARSRSEKDHVKAQPKPSALNKLALLALPSVLMEQAHSPRQAPKLVHDIVLSQLLDEPNKALKDLAPAQQLALVEVAVPALRQASEADRLNLLKDLETMANSQDLFHWGLYQLLARQLLPKARFKETLDNDQALQVTVEALQRTDAGQKVDRQALCLALNTCRGWSPKAKQTLIDNWLTTVRADDVISPAERQLLAILCACIEVPLPDEMLQ
ncbi:M48 family metallopeptidase [Pseudidiomarina terrestris]|uniref:M48 family metallopeptidase n=1 Tax=Pseudidiomarina terrestris TaxID=2820060 RepID=A0AAW7R0W0_9GAMM|nr:MULTISPECIES: M48 family metallopeptidase [unclassified Pseudidiomarina]MDN7124928.1 M48 family metallopeptidase [Pseudidiomarina sp. 1APP75-32.1]MDN7126001.1 M48 family metallopeptidase [Pseudidiomarina sp. 1APR75-33.1]MDN7129599.1 M48 family metallopeptidase [Pseudidiomarina sp. 1APR75-15]MDN7135914.1 M48 family metallopeptidase [Pseudidiomarina sp. 1ASP75-5]MDN7138148.1 M48 family metallopeptidase [Pseudidiomarina sp. 1ASP75-14]